ncbi:MAG: glycosyltransferase family 4 protein [Bacteroidales bacterium]
MKVLEINKYFYLKGGTETVFFSTIKLLLERNHDVVIYTTKDARNAKGEGATLYEHDYPELRDCSMLNKLKYILRFFYNIPASREIEQIILKEKPDIAHVHLLFNSFSISILRVLKKHGIPVVYHAHDYRLLCPNYLLFDSELNICEECLGKSVIPCVRKRCSRKNLLNSSMLALDMWLRRKIFPINNYIQSILCVSSFSKEKHIKMFPLNRENIKTLYNPVNVTPCATNLGEYLLYYGRISHEKGLRLLIEAIKEIPEIPLVIVGGGDSELLTDLPANVIWEGYKPYEQLTSIINKARYVVVPSMWYETFGLSIVESYGRKTPVIGANHGGIKEIISDNKTGFLFQAGDKNSLQKIIRLSWNLPVEEYNQLAENAFEKYKEFSGIEYIQSLENEFYKILAR